MKPLRLGLIADAAIGMLAPGVFLGLLWARTSAVGVFAGMLVGYAALLLPAARTFCAAQLPEWDAGLVAMGVNAAVVLLVSSLLPARSSDRSPR